MSLQDRRFVVTPDPVTSDPVAPGPEKSSRKDFPDRIFGPDGETYRTTWEVCPDPLCPCCELAVRAVPQDAQEPSADLRFRVDVELWDLVAEQDPYAPDERAEVLVASWDTALWNRLFQAYHDAKFRRLAEVDLESLGAERPFPIDEIEAPPGFAVGWNEIVPFDVQLSVETDDLFFVVDDAYDLSSGPNRSDDVLLTFLSGRRLEHIEPEREPFLGPVSVVQLNPATGAHRVVHEEPGAPADELLDLTLRLPGVPGLFEERRRILRTMYRRRLDAVGHVPLPPKIDFWCFAPEIPGPPVFVTFTFSVDPPRGSKVGRNQPCPCGSGKKFKKCCGP